MLLIRLPEVRPELPPGIRTAAIGMLGFMAALSLFGIATGIGLILLRNWARISVLIWGGLSVFFGVIGILFAFLLPTIPPASPAELPEGGQQLLRWILLFLYGMPLIAGVWWLILFNRKAIKAQFAGVAASADTVLPQKPRCPLPITVLAWFYVTAILNLLFLPFLPFRVPLFVFGIVLHGSMGLALLSLSSVVFFVCGVGMLKLKPWSYALTMGLQGFWLASTAVSMFRPDYGAVMDAYLREVQTSMHLPATQFPPGGFAHHFGWVMALGLVFGGAILGLLVYYRQRFLEAASAAASSSRQRATV